MRVLIFHNSYKIRGGEDSVVLNEKDLLIDSGCEVFVKIISNDNISGVCAKTFAALSCVFSVSQYFRVRRALKDVKPDVVHVHNYFPLLSPSVFFACKSLKIPVVHTLHNFRAICPTATLMWNGKVCEKSIYFGSWWALKEKVYKNSFMGTLLLILMIEINKKFGVWNKVVDGYIALTDFSKNKYIEAGWPRDKIYVKPNFSDCRVSGNNVRGRYALYVGRLSDEKGIKFLLEVFSGSELKIKFIGDGPLRPLVEASVGDNVEYLGSLAKDGVLEVMTDASCLVMASTWYEGFPMVIVEALGCGLPIVVPKLGNMESIVKHGVFGLHYEPKNRKDMLDSVSKIIENPVLVDYLSKEALREFDVKYTSDKNLHELLDIYKMVVVNNRVD